MKKILSGLMLWGLFVGGCPVWPESPPTLTLDQAIDTALLENPQLKAVHAKLGLSQAEIVTASARLNPALLTDNGVAEKTYRLGIEQTLELGGKRKKRIALAQAQKEVVMAEINTAILNLKADVRRAYTHLYYVQQKQRTHEELVQRAEQLVYVTQQRERAGDVALLDVLQAEIIRVNTRNELETIAYQVVEARNKLNSLLNQSLDKQMVLAAPSGMPAGALSPAPDTLQGGITQNVANLEMLIQDALANRPELQQSERRGMVAERELELAKANRTPNLLLIAGPDLVVSGGGENALNMFVVGGMQIPLFNRQQGPIQEALARQILVEAERSALKNQIILEVSNAYNALVAQQERVNRYENELIPKAQWVRDKSQRSFEEGKSSVLMPINAQQAYMNTRLGYLQAQVDLQNAINDLERAVGIGQ